MYYENHRKIPVKRVQQDALDIFCNSAAVLALQCYSMGGINWQNDAYEKHFPLLAILSLTTGFLLFLFPLVVIAVLIYNYRKWRKLLPALLSYSLYLGFVMLAAYMGWWVD